MLKNQSKKNKHHHDELDDVFPGEGEKVRASRENDCNHRGNLSANDTFTLAEALLK